MPALLTRMSRRPNLSTVAADHGLPVVLVGHIQAQENCILADRIGHRLAILLIQVGHHHPGALAREQDGVCLAHTTGAACDDCHFTGDSAHAV